MRRFCLLLMISVLALQESASKSTSGHWRAPTSNLTGNIGAWRSGVNTTTRAETETELKPVGKPWPWTWGEIPPQNFYDCLYIYYACTDNEIPGWQENEGKCKKAYNYCVAYIASNNSSPTDKYLTTIAKPVEEFTVRPPPNQTKWEFDFSDILEIPTVEPVEPAQPQLAKVNNPSAESTPVKLLVDDVNWTWQDPTTKKTFAFTVVQQSMKWTEAMDTCASMGARLAQPDTQEKNNNIVEKIRSIGVRNYYFGASRYPNGDVNSPVTDQWTYTDGSLVNFNNWGPDQPNNWHGKQPCGIYWIHSNLMWNDDYCGRKFHFICETPVKGSSWTWTDPETKRKFDFTLVEEQLNWSDAKDVCTQIGERLAQPDTQGKNQFLTEKLRAAKGFTGDGVWFGASRNIQNINQWLYTDGSEVAFTSWNSGEPNNAGNSEGCAEWRKDHLFMWNDHFCGETKQFFCEASQEVENPLAEARVGNVSNKQAHESVHQPINLLDGGAYAPEESELTWTWEDPATSNASYIQKFAYTLFNKEALPWHAASNVCASMRARLAQPDSQQKVDFIAELLRSQKQPRAWFGGSPHHSGHTNWPAVKPYSSGDEEQCGEFWFWTYTDLSWIDTPCSFKNHFICETPIQVKNALLW